MSTTAVTAKRGAAKKPAGKADKGLSPFAPTQGHFVMIAIERITPLNTKTLSILVESVKGFADLKVSVSTCKRTEDFLRLAMQAIVADGLGIWASGWYDGSQTIPKANRILSLAKVDLKSLVSQATTERKAKAADPKAKAKSK